MNKKDSQEITEITFIPRKDSIKVNFKIHTRDIPILIESLQRMIKHSKIKENTENEI